MFFLIVCFSSEEEHTKKLKKPIFCTTMEKMARLDSVKSNTINCDVMTLHSQYCADHDLHHSGSPNLSNCTVISRDNSMLKGTT